MISDEPKASGSPETSSGLDAISTDAATLARRFVRIVHRQANGIVAFASRGETQLAPENCAGILFFFGGGEPH